MSKQLFPAEGLISKESWDKLSENEKQKIGDYCNMVTREHVYKIFGPYVAPYDHPDVKDCHPKPSRQEYNNKIVEILRKDDKFCEIIKKYGNLEMFFDLVNDCVNSKPQQRFGQIFCNYICIDYRDSSPHSSTTEILSYIFPENPDPFFEESAVTYNRLKTSDAENGTNLK